MAGIVAAESVKSKRGPKVLQHLEIHPQLGGGHIVKHVYDGYEHEAKPYQFGKDEGERAMKHIARHAGLPHSAGTGGDGEEPAEEMD